MLASSTCIAVATRTLLAYQKLTESNGLTRDNVEEEAETLVLDMLVDLRHLAVALNLDLEDLLLRSEAHYSEEVADAGKGEGDKLVDSAGARAVVAATLASPIPPRSEVEQLFFEAAKEEWTSDTDDIEIDDDARVSVNTDPDNHRITHAWVQAWVRITEDDVELPLALDFQPEAPLPAPPAGEIAPCALVKVVKPPKDDQGLKGRLGYVASLKGKRVDVTLADDTVVLPCSALAVLPT